MFPGLMCAARAQDGRTDRPEAKNHPWLPVRERVKSAARLTLTRWPRTSSPRLPSRPMRRDTYRAVARPDEPEPLVALRHQVMPSRAESVLGRGALLLLRPPAY